MVFGQEGRPTSASGLMSSAVGKALGLFERAEDQTFVPSKELRQVEIERALRLLRQGTAGLL